MCKYCEINDIHYVDMFGNDIGCEICCGAWSREDAREDFANGGFVICPVCGADEPMELILNEKDEIVGCSDCVRAIEYEVEKEEEEYDEDHERELRKEREWEERRLCYGTPYQF